MLSRWQSTIVDAQGNVQPLANLTVRLESDQSLAKMWASPGTTQPLPDGMVQADGNGYAFFYARGGLYRIQSVALGIDWRHVQIGAALVSIGDYGPGLEITARNQVFWRDGELYRAGAVLELPYTTTGDWGAEEGLFVAVGDQALRGDLSEPTGATFVGFQQAGEGAIPRTLLSKAREFVSVKDFGAKGDGVTNDTAAIQAAMDHLTDRTDASTGWDTPLGYGGTVFFPPGDYLIDNLIWRSYVTLEGHSAQSVFLIPSENTNGFLFDLQNTSDRPKGITVREITVSPVRNVSQPYSSRPDVSAFNIEGFEKQCFFDRVHIYNILGTGIKTGDTQDILFNALEIRFVGKPLDIDRKLVGGPGGPLNPTNAVKFIACRLENSGTSTIQRQRSTHFVSCKFEEAFFHITSPHGVDFIGCDWALTNDFAITVDGTVNRGLRIIGGSTDTGIPIGSGSSGARFITSTIPVQLIGMMFRGHAPQGIYGEVSVYESIFSECERPYVFGGGSAYYGNNFSYQDAGGTGGNAPFRRASGNSYVVPTSMIPDNPVESTWYTNTSNRAIRVYLRLPYSADPTNSTYQIKTRHASGLEYTLGNISHSTGNGEDILPVDLLPGESIWVNQAGGASGASATAFYR